MRTLTIAAVLLSVWPAAGQAPQATKPILWRFAHPDTKALIGVDFRSVTNSELGRAVQDQFKLNYAATEGMEFVTTLDRMLISATTNMKNPKNMSLLVLAEGSFDLVGLRKKAKEEGARRSTYKVVEILSAKSDDGTKLSLALLSDRMLLFGDEASVVAAIDRGEPTGAPGLLFARAQQLSEKYDLWMAVSVPPGTLSAQQQLASVPFLNAVDTIDGGISFRDGLAAQFDLGTKSEEAARMLAANLRALLNMAAMQNADSAEFAKKLQLDPDQTFVRLALSMDRPEMEQKLAEWKKATPAAKTKQLASAAVVPKKPEGPKKIRIYGLDDGTKEIPFSK